MSKIRPLVILSLLLSIVSFSSPSYADPKPWVWSWKSSHWDNQNFIPYLEDGKLPHNSQWNESRWTPEDWKTERLDKLSVVKEFYWADILRDQYVDDDIPVLEVGPEFYKLGGQDKRRVVETVDSIYGITSNKLFGMFILSDWKSRKTIGVYTQYGLQLQ